MNFKKNIARIGRIAGLLLHQRYTKGCLHCRSASNLFLHTPVA